MNKDIKVVFFGTPEFVVSIPKALKASFGLLACVTASDKPVGRKKVLTPSPIKVWANENKIPVIDSPSLSEITRKVKDLKPDVGILAAYGKIIPQELISAFPKGILVIHPSLLPKYRGASPVQAAIAVGNPEIGVSIIKMDEKMDHGPIVSQFKEELPPDATPDKLYHKLFAEASEVLVTILTAYLEGRIKLREQNHTQATFTKILKREDGYIDFKNPPSPEVFERMVRAYHPWPGVWSKWKMENGKWKIIKFLPEEKLQLEGKKPMSSKDFLKGYPEAKTWLTKIYPNLS